METTNETKELVLKQVDYIIDTYKPEKSDKFFSHDVQCCLLTVGSGFCIEEYYQIGDESVKERLHNAFVKEAAYYKKHCGFYCSAEKIQSRLKLLRNRVEKILTPKQTQAERNVEFQNTVISLLTEILELIKK